MRLSALASTTPSFQGIERLGHARGKARQGESFDGHHTRSARTCDPTSFFDMLRRRTGGQRLRSGFEDVPGKVSTRDAALLELRPGQLGQLFVLGGSPHNRRRSTSEPRRLCSHTLPRPVEDSANGRAERGVSRLQICSIDHESVSQM